MLLFNDKDKTTSLNDTDTSGGNMKLKLTTWRLTTRRYFDVVEQYFMLFSNNGFTYLV